MNTNSTSWRQSSALEIETDAALGSELNTTADGVALTEARTEPTNSFRQLRRYCAVLLAIPFVYMIICYALMRSDYMVRHTQYTYIANMGYGLKLKNADCKVLVYGDSSALIGLDPGVLTRITGLSACNVADYAGMLRLNGTIVLDRYLQNNARPQYLVILLSPDGFGPFWRHDGNYEAVLMRVRENPDLRFFYTLLRHGEDILSAIGVSGRFALTDMVRKPLPPTAFLERDVTRGRFPDPERRSTSCPPDLRDNPPNLDWVRGLRTRYGVGGTKVIVDVVPVPPCEPGLGAYEHEFGPGNGVVDNQMEIYPLDWYTQSGRWHLGSPEGWERLSTEVAHQIQQSPDVRRAP